MGMAPRRNNAKGIVKLYNYFDAKEISSKINEVKLIQESGGVSLAAELTYIATVPKILLL